MFTVLICGFTCVLPLILCTQIKLLHIFSVRNDWMLVVCVFVSHSVTVVVGWTTLSVCTFVCVCA